jgi:hypothetical protein
MTIDHALRVREPYFQFGPVGRCPKHGTLLICLFDESGSVIGPVGADPASNRYGEARAAFHQVYAHCWCDRELGAVLHFDSPTNRDVQPVSISKNIKRIEAGLTIPHGIAGQSLLGPSLDAAIEMADRYPEHDATLVVFSDFALFDPDVDQVFTRLNEFPGEVHAVVLNASFPDGLLDERIQVTRIGRSDPPGAVATALFESLTRHRRPS